MTSAIRYTDNYIDLAGLSGLAFLPDSNHILTCGSSPEVRLWQVDDSQIEPIQEFPSNDSAIDVSANDKYLFAALKDKSVMYRQRNSDESELSLLFESPTELSCIDLQQSPYNRLLLGYADGTINLFKPDESSWIETNSFKAHNGRVYSVKFDDANDRFISSGSDGNIIFWSLESCKEIKRFNGCVQTEFDENTKLVPTTVHPSNKHFVIIQHNILVGYDSEFEKCFETPIMDNVGKLLFVSFSSDGKYVATCDPFRVFIFEWKTNNSSEHKPIVQKDFDSSQHITGLEFSTVKPLDLAAVNNEGVLFLMKLELESNLTTTPKTNIDDCSEFLDDDDDFEDLLNEIPMETAPKASATLKEETKVNSPAVRKLSPIPDDDFGDVFDDALDDNNTNNNDDDGDDEMDIGAIKRSYEPLIFGDEPGPSKATSNSLQLDKNGEFFVDGFRIEGKELVNLIRQSKKAGIESMQEPFQSGSTPVHHQRRFMVWNGVGIIYAHHDESENSIDVEFHDTTFHHTIHLENDLNFTIADLSPTCLVLASNKDDVTDEERTKIFCQLLKTWDKIKTWDTSLPNGEFVEALCAGTNFVAIASSNHYLRVWNIGGVQTMVISLYGPPLTVSACENQLMLLYHQATHFAGRGQSIGCQVLKIDHRAKTRKHPLDKTVQVALSPNSTVYWAGFTDEFTPCIVDSKCIIRLYKPHFGGSWVPVADLKRANNALPLDHFFVVGISELLNQVRCLFCKASKYPITSPRPIMMVKPLEVPLTDMDTQKGKYEESLFRNRLNCSLLKKLSLDGFEIDNNLETSMKLVNTSCVKLFALALIAGRESVALEIVKLMPDNVAIEGAIRFAREKNNRSMATRLMELLQMNEEEESENEEDTELEKILHHRTQESQGDEWLDQLKDDKHRSKVALSKVSSGSDTDSVSLRPKKMGAVPEKNVLKNVRNYSPEPEQNSSDSTPKLVPEKLSGKNPFKRSAETAKLQSSKRKKV